MSRLKAGHPRRETKVERMEKRIARILMVDAVVTERKVALLEATKQQKAKKPAQKR